MLVAKRPNPTGPSGHPLDSYIYEIIAIGRAKLIFFVGFSLKTLFVSILNWPKGKTA